MRIALSTFALLCLLSCISCTEDDFFPGPTDSSSIQLRAAEEPRLRPTESSDTEVFRFSWIPSFHPTVVVRVVRTGSEVILTGTRLTGRGGYEPGIVGERTYRKLSIAQWNQFIALLESASFWSVPSEQPPVFENGVEVIGVDGAHWLLEGADNSRYHFVDRWFHEYYPDFEQACICLMTWSELHIASETLRGYGVDVGLTGRCS